MLRKLFSSPLAGSEPGDGPVEEVNTNPAATAADTAGAGAGSANDLAANAGFDEIYQKATNKIPKTAWGIQKLREMAESPHLAGMNSETKRSAILMALEAAGARVEDILQDAVLRQKALNEYEEREENRLRDFEAVKTEHNRAIQTELDRITAQNMARIQANMDEIARQQDNFRAWKKRKTAESETIAGVAALLVPQGSAQANAGGSPLAVVLERASAAYR
ncbi:MAG TPA: hypothetical protein VEF06_01185 [Bryobacteraceae bacterium]|nr:hypothetical protein [Bryobacteraceae bacterium]